MPCHKWNDLLPSIALVTNTVEPSWSTIWDFFYLKCFSLACRFALFVTCSTQLCLHAARCNYNFRLHTPNMPCLPTQAIRNPNLQILSLIFQNTGCTFFPLEGQCYHSKTLCKSCFPTVESYGEVLDGDHCGSESLQPLCYLLTLSRVLLN